MRQQDTHYSNSWGAVEASRDEGLRAYMLSVYNIMGVGLGISALVAAMVAWTDLQSAFYASNAQGKLSLTGLGLIASFGPLVMLLGVAFMNVRNWSASAAGAFFYVFAALQGVGLAVYFSSYPTTDIIRAFLVSASMFAGLSLWGYTTKRDLGMMGVICVMGLCGLIVTALLGMLFGFTVSGTLFSLVGLALFAGLTAYDTQSIKQAYLEGDVYPSGPVWGALSLYLDALAMFKFVLSLLGNRD